MTNPGIEAKIPYSRAAYRQLRSWILDNEMPAGYQATEQEVASVLGMSRTPTREAMLRLENEGLIELRSRHGMRVLPISTDDMREIYEILTGLEASAAASVAEKGANETEIAELESSVADMDQALDNDDLVSWMAADARFHHLLVDFSGNKRLASVVDIFLTQAARARKLTVKLRPKPTKSNIAHAAVVDAIKNRDSDKAWRVHMQHRKESGEMLIGLLQDLGFPHL